LLLANKTLYGMLSLMKLENITIINGYLTAVYFTPDLGWRYTIVLQDGSLFQPYDLYESSTEAYEVVQSIIHLVMACDQESAASS
jgi:hypothetical protein